MYLHGIEGRSLAVIVRCDEEAEVSAISSHPGEPVLASRGLAPLSGPCQNGIQEINATSLHYHVAVPQAQETVVPRFLNGFPRI